MKFYNLKHKDEKLSFREAAIKGQGKEKGLFFPERIPRFSKKFLDAVPDLSAEEIGFECMKDFTEECIPQEKLREICRDTASFPIPLKKINEKISVLELFHGPTLAFKDVGARFMSRCLGYFLKDEKRKITVLAATSGDTGGAVANGFYNIPNIEVVILYPENRVSPVQEKQLAALGGNIRALEVAGTFDDCQNLVKQAFADDEINENILLTSANSINVARWLPQQIYYLLAYRQQPEICPIISVPSGNFGNICAGLLAHARGLPAKKFIAACNENDAVPQYLETKIFSPKETVPTLSNAMDVGNPSNFVRILELFNQEYNSLRNSLSGTKTGDEETAETIKKVYEKYRYILDPHGAVAYKALQDYLKNHPDEKGYFLETAHPVKFPEAVEKAISHKLEIPGSLQSLMNAEKKSTKMMVDFQILKSILLEN